MSAWLTTPSDLRWRTVPGRRNQRDDAALETWAGDIVRELSSDVSALDLPLDVRTAFQQRVWQALRAIGRQHAHLRRTCDGAGPANCRPRCGAAPAQPTGGAAGAYRVVGEGGDMRGYRWGVERKRALLKREAERR